MSCKFYLTDWMPEIGRFGIITSACQGREPYDFAGETFVFALDGEPFFCGKRLTYQCRETTGRPNHVDEEFMHRKALGRAKDLIGLRKATLDGEVKNIEVCRREVVARECEGRLDFPADVRCVFADRLQEVVEQTWNQDLKDNISLILSGSEQEWAC